MKGKAMKKILLILLCFIILILSGCNSYEDVFENEIFLEPSKAVNVVLKQGGDYSLYPNVMYGWGLKKNVSAPPDIPEATKTLIKKYNAYYIDEGSKNIYLTFDEGYENGYTSKILDVLKDNNVPAAFFITGPYLKNETELVKRMVKEGHVVGNHSVNHPSLPSVTSDEELKNEIAGLSRQFKDMFGKDMKYLRPPRGEYSERTLAITRDMGYTNVFWSFAYKDWEVNNQKGTEFAYQEILKGVHDGAVLLLHAVSKDNAEVLDSVIKELKNRGYVFKSLDEFGV
ncbi:MAG: delta-lactam-biosynthetic de-N-acetylase [Ruminococcaceae bacterium]|nr:delta-lactam-biosynthetic de-N-acetylase [Oscillospiraceae bacterium]